MKEPRVGLELERKEQFVSSQILGEKKSGGREIFEMHHPRFSNFWFFPTIGVCVFFSQKYFQTAIYLSNCFVLKLGNIDIDVKGSRIFKRCCCCCWTCRSSCCWCCSFVVVDVDVGDNVEVDFDDALLLLLLLMFFTQSELIEPVSPQASIFIAFKTHS